jgi:hypothetical protein
MVYLVNFRHFKLTLKVKFMNINDLDFFKTVMNKYTSNKDKVLESLNKLKNILASESKETTEMLEIYRKYAAGEKIDKTTMEKANSQFTDLIKNVGLLGVFALPGGLVAIPLLVKLGKKLGIDILPKSYKD